MIPQSRTLPKRILALLLVGACGVPALTTTDTGPTSLPSTTSSASTTVPLPSTSVASTAPTVTSTAPATTTNPEFLFTVNEVSAEELGASWREGCPVAPSDLSRVTLTHFGYDGSVREGELIVATVWAEDLASVFLTLLEAGFPIERVEPVSAYGADDDASMAANNTSAFNCRTVAGTSRWSEHAYGRAIDINPLVNPYVSGSQVEPPGGEAYLDRDPSVPGLIVDGDVVVEAFASIGWEWGGHWESVKDYQHFSATGR